jgi:hypothetical protein
VAFTLNCSCSTALVQCTCPVMAGVQCSCCEYAVCEKRVCVRRCCVTLRESYRWGFVSAKNCRNPSLPFGVKICLPCLCYVSCEYCIFPTPFSAYCKCCIQCNSRSLSLLLPALPVVETVVIAPRSHCLVMRPIECIDAVADCQCCPFVDTVDGCERCTLLML